MRKIRRIIIGVLAFIIIGVVALVVCCKNSIEKEQANSEKITGYGDKQALVLYQESVSSMVKDNVDEITSVLQKSGYSTVSNHPRADLDYKIQDYDVIVFVSPVIARKVAQPLLDFADKQDFSGKKVYSVIVGMREDKGEKEKLEKHIKNATEKETIKVIGSDRAEMLENLEGFISE